MDRASVGDSRNEYSLDCLKSLNGSEITLVLKFSDLSLLPIRQVNGTLTRERRNDQVDRFRCLRLTRCNVGGGRVARAAFLWARRHDYTSPRSMRGGESTN